MRCLNSIMRYCEITRVHMHVQWGSAAFVFYSGIYMGAICIDLCQWCTQFFAIYLYLELFTSLFTLARSLARSLTLSFSVFHSQSFLCVFVFCMVLSNERRVHHDVGGIFSSFNATTTAHKMPLQNDTKLWLYRRFSVIVWHAKSIVNCSNESSFFLTFF